MLNYNLYFVREKIKKNIYNMYNTAVIVVTGTKRETFVLVLLFLNCFSQSYIV